ncbi:MAG: class I SAM-dependent methyltransferase [Ignavibacteriales bacterium]|nr:class I SAM-dependent methyltransferase [Ignavibacteriales bacterium]
MSENQLTCKICNGISKNKILKVREMYFGTREVFDYLECSNCGCLQLLNPPKNYSAHYPQDYFTYQQKHESKFKALLNRLRDRAALGEKTLIGSIIYKKFGEPTYITRLKIAGVGLNDSILDVGCGKGILLHKMKESGFNKVIGLDPFLDETITYKNGLKIIKQNFDEFAGKFDFIMFNHSFEHMEKPDEVMKQSNKLLNKGKYLLIRIPVADSYAFKKYRENWCSLDAPRHLFLHTTKSIQILAQTCGFEVKKINYDSRSWQLWGSEQYSKNISLMDKRSYYVNPKNSIFTKKEIVEFEKRVLEFNKNGEGDQAEFYLQKIN